MRIKSELLWGERIRDKDKMRDLLHIGKLPSGYYLLLCNGKGDLEFTPAWMQHNRYYASDEFSVFGVAYNKKEACQMIADIVSDIYAANQYKSLKEYVREVLVAEPC